MGSFDPLLPAAPVYSGPSGVLGPTNLIDLTPTVRVTLSQALSMTGECGTFWRQNLADGVYTPLVTPLRSGQNPKGRHVATAPSITLTWKADRHTTVSIIYTRFFAGAYFRNAKLGLAKAEIDRMASAFEHQDLQAAQAPC